MRRQGFGGWGQDVRGSGEGLELVGKNLGGQGKGGKTDRTRLWCVWVTGLESGMGVCFGGR